jgi:hypothetical protein
VNRWGKMPCDLRMAQIWGRDGDFVDVVRIKRVKTVDDDFVTIEYDLLEVLKAKKPSLNSIDVRKHLKSTFIQATSGVSERLLQPGGDRILFLSEVLERPTVISYCPVMTLTPQALSATIKDIADDRSGILGE